jgi:hypothetical protein
MISWFLHGLAKTSSELTAYLEKNAGSIRSLKAYSRNSRYVAPIDLLLINIGVI